jgi:hypothetical protein
VLGWEILQGISSSAGIDVSLEGYHKAGKISWAS